MLRRLGGLTGRALPLADQVLISSGNFLSGVVVARSLEPHEFGVWVLASVLLWMLTPLQGGLMLQPLVVNAAGRDRADFGRYLRTLLPLQIGFVVLGSFVIALAALLWEPVRPYALPVWLAASALLGQDFARRVLYARARMAPAVVSNFLNFTLQACVLGAVAIFGVLTLSTALWIVAATSLLALAVAGGALLPLVGSERDDVRSAARRMLEIGRWTAPAQLLRGAGEHAFPALVGALAGLSAAGGYGVMVQIGGALHLICRPIENYFLPRASDAVARHGPGALRGVTRDIAIVAAAPLALFVAGAVVAPDLLLAMVYGERYGQFAAALRIYAIAKLLQFTFDVLELHVQALRRQRSLLQAELAGVVVAFALGALLLPSMQLMGAALVWVAVDAVRVSWVLRAVFWSTDPPGRTSTAPQPEAIA